MDIVDDPETNNTHTKQSDDDFKIKGAALRAKTSGKQKEASDNCIICLQAITDRAVAVPCNHLAFDFVCLVSWLQQRETCPLCQLAVTEVHYNWQDADDYQVYHLEQTQSPQRGQRTRSQARTPNHGWSRVAPSERNVRSTGSHDLGSFYRENPALAQRRRVYQERLYSLHVGANNISQYRDFTPQDFANSTSLQSRARMFLRRELKLFTHLDTEEGVRNREFVLEYIVAVLKRFDVKASDGRAEDLLSEFLEQSNAKLLLRELYSWLRSPYTTLESWDRNVQYPQDMAKALATKTSGTG